MKYTVKKLDRRFSLCRNAGFEYMLEWPPCYYEHTQGSVYSDFRRTLRLVEERLGGQYYQYAQPEGRWTATQSRVGLRKSKICHRIYLRTAKHLTMVQLG